jgi:hypothetical protein
MNTKVIIKYNKDTDEYLLYSEDLDTVFTSNELFKTLVMFNSYMTSINENFNILKSDDIEYLLDSNSMKKIITSNVELIKKLNKLPTEFQMSSEKFGSQSYSGQSKFSSKRNDKFVSEFSKLSSKKKFNKF